MSKWKRPWKKWKKGSIRTFLTELRWVLAYGVKYRWAVALYVFLGLVNIAMSLWASVLSKDIVDAVTGYSSAALLPAAVFYGVMQLGRIGLNAWTGRISAKTELKVDQEIRAEVYDKIMAADWESVSRYHSGDLLNRVDNDVASVSASVLGWMPDGVTRLAQFLGALAIILYHDPSLALLALAGAPVTMIVSRFTVGRLREYGRKIRESGSKVMTFNQESFRNVQTIKSFGLGDLYSTRLRQVQGEYRELKLEFNKYSVTSTALMSFAGTLVAMACFGFGVYRLWSGEITYGVMTLFLQMATTLSGALSGLVQLVPGAISAATAAGRIMAVTQLPHEDRQDDQAAEVLLRENREQGIEVRTQNLGFHYQGGREVFSGAELLASPGEIVALVGPSGEGKTTMLRLLLGIVLPKAGSVLLTGKKTGQSLRASASTRSFFAYVPQEDTMFDGTVAENLRMIDPTATEERLWQVLDLACAGEFVRKMPRGLHTPLIEDGGGVSRGQLQRLSIARALLADAPVLLLDEATSALDVATERRVLRNILGAKQNRTVIVTTHRPSVLTICSRVYEISAGRIRTLNAHEVEQKIADF